MWLLTLPILLALRSSFASSIPERGFPKRVEQFNALTTTSPLEGAFSNNSLTSLSRNASQDLSLGVTHYYTVPWPADREWPFTIEWPANLQQHDDEFFLLEHLRTVKFIFYNPGRNCIYKGQRDVFEHAFLNFYLKWPKLPLTAGHDIFEQHDRVLDFVLRLSFQVDQGLISGTTPFQRALWSAAQLAMQELLHQYRLREHCKLSIVLLTANFQDGRSVRIGTVQVEIKEPPPYNHQRTWPNLFHEWGDPIRMPIIGEAHYPETYLEFSEKSDLPKRIPKWSDPDPISRHFVPIMFKDAVNMLRLTHDRNNNIDVIGTSAPYIGYRLHVVPYGNEYSSDHDSEYEHGKPWDIPLTTHILQTLSQLVMRYGLIGTLINVFVQDQKWGSIDLTAIDPPGTEYPIRYDR